jgi:hypothetical protein
MDDFDAKNHLRDIHREADLRRLAQLAKAGQTSSTRDGCHGRWGACCTPWETGWQGWVGG